MDDPLDVSAESVEIYPGISSHSKSSTASVSGLPIDSSRERDIVEESHDSKNLSNLRILQKRHQLKRRLNNNNIKLQALNLLEKDIDENQSISRDQNSHNDLTEVEDDNDTDISKEAPVLRKGWLGKIGRGRQRAPMRILPRQDKPNERSEEDSVTSMPPVLPPVVSHRQGQGHDRRTSDAPPHKSPRLRHRKHAAVSVDAMNGGPQPHSPRRRPAALIHPRTDANGVIDDGSEEGVEDSNSLPKLGRKRKGRKKPLFLKLQEEYDEKESELERLKLEKYRQEAEKRKPQASIRETVEAHQAHLLQAGMLRRGPSRADAEEDVRQAPGRRQTHAKDEAPLLKPPHRKAELDRGPVGLVSVITEGGGSGDAIHERRLVLGGKVGAEGGGRGGEVVRGKERGGIVRQTVDQIILSGEEDEDEEGDAARDLIRSKPPLGVSPSLKIHTVVVPADDSSNLFPRPSAVSSDNVTGKINTYTDSKTTGLSDNSSFPLHSYNSKSASTLPHDWVSVLLEVDSDEEKLAEIYEAGFSMLMMEQDDI